MRDNATDAKWGYFGGYIIIIHIVYKGGFLGIVLNH
jgi:hypothetical protein